MSVFSDPAITPNFRCPNCGELLRYGTKLCKNCFEEIDERDADFNTIVQFALTQAGSLANIVGAFDPAVIIFALATLIMCWLKSELYNLVPKFWITFEIAFMLCWLLPLAAIIRWLYMHGRWNIIDEEYSRTKKNMWLSLRMWLAAYTVHVVLMLMV